MSTEKHLFHIMVGKMKELAIDGSLTPDKGDLSTLFDVLRVSLRGMTETPATMVARSALRLAGSELRGDLDYYITDRSECFDSLLDFMVICGVLDELQGDNHTAYIREH